MIKNNLSRILGEKRMSMAELSRISGLHSNTVFYLFHDRSKQVEFRVIDKLCKALKCNTQELFEFIDDEGSL